MKKLAADHKLMACLAAILIVTAMLGVVSNSILSGLSRTFETAVNSTARKLQLSGDINMDAGDMLEAQREASVDTKAATANMQLFDAKSAEIDSDAAELKSLSVNQEERKIVGIVEENNATYREAVHQVDQLHAMGPDESSKVTKAYKDIDEITDQLETLEAANLKADLGETRTRLMYGRIALGVCAGLALLIVVIALQTVTGIGATLRASAEEARASAGQARASAAFSELLMNSMPCAVCILDVKGNLKRGNKNFLGYSREEMLEKGVLSMVKPESLEAVKRALVKTLEEGYAETEAYLVSSEGTTIPTYLTQTRFLFKGQPCILGVGIDISKQKKAEQYSRLQQAALESASEGIIITDATGKIEWANHAFTTLTGYELEEVLGMNPRILKSGMMDRAFYRTLWSTILDGEKWSGELWNLRKDGNVYCEEMHIAPVRVVNEGISNFVAVKHDITERKHAQEEAERAKEGLVLLNKELREANEHILKISQTDALTGLANRRTLDERMRHEMARADRLGCGFSLILGDLDHFKSINDEFGHLVGDRVLVAASAVMADQARPYDLPARFGGEEFMVLLPESTLEDAMTIAQRIRTAIAGVTVPDVTRQITMSLGISTWGHGDTLGALVGRADAALYQAKRRGRNRVVAQTSDMPPTISGHMLAEAQEALVKTA
ncbi:MAG TPA: diguanylate cyclase [Acidobacteriaceae bacterium]|nr:diguanylate cyclase [Acidobacteriaceae bacterium]